MRRAVRLTVWTAAGILVLIALLVGAVLAIANTTGGRSLIERTTARLTGGEVRISGLSGTLPAHIAVGTLELSDDAGVWLTARRIDLHWSPLDIIGWRLRVASLTVGELDVIRAPRAEGPPNSEGGGAGPSLPRIDVRRFSIATLVLEPPLAGTRTAITLQGGIYLKSLDAATADITAHRIGGNGDYEVDLRFDRKAMNATLRLEEPASGPLEHLMRVPGLGALSVVASIAGPHRAERVRLDAEAGALRAHVQGTLDLERLSADFAYALSSPAIAPRPDIAWQRLSLEGTWHGTLDAPQAAGRLQIGGLELPGHARIGALEATLNAGSGVIAMRVSVGGLVLPGRAPRLFTGGPVRLNAALHMTEAGRPLDLTLDQRLLSLTARVVTQGQRSATLALRVPDLAPFAELTHLKLSGGATVNGTLAEKAAAVSFDLAARTGVGGIPVLSDLLGSAARIRLVARWAPQGLDVSKLEVMGSALSFSGSGSAERVAPGTRGAAPGARGAPLSVWQLSNVRWQLAVSRLSALAPTLEGTLSLNGEASGPASSPAARIRATANLSVRGSPPGSLDVSLATRGLPSALAGTLQVQGRFDGAPLALDASLDRGRGELAHLVLQHADWKSVHLDADVHSGPHLESASGTARVRIADLMDLEPLIGRPIAGEVQGNVTLGSSAGRTVAQLEIAAQHLSAAGLVGDVRLAGSGPVDALPLTLAARIANHGGRPASLDAALAANLPRRKLALEKIEARYQGETVRLLAPARVAFEHGVKVTGLALGAGHAVFKLDGEIVPTLDLHTSLSGVDAALVNAFEPHLLARGTLGADARLTGTLAAPRGRVTLEVSRLKMANSSARDLPSIGVRGTAQLSDAGAEIDAELDAGRASKIKLRGRAPLSGSDTYDLKLSGTLDAALANPLLEAHGARTAGTLTVDATVTGPAGAPTIGGALDIAGGDLRDYASGLHLGAITARMVGGRGVLRIASFSARAGTGTVSLSGTLGVLEPHLPIDLELSAKHAQPIASDLLTADLDADIKVQGTLRKRIDITGRIHVDNAQIGVPNALPPNVAVLDVRRPGEAPPPPVQHRLAIGLDLTLSAPRQILVQGRGLDAELGGSLTIRGTTQNPQVRGGFQMIMGTFALASTQLMFTSGQVSFTGAGLRNNIDPSLDFVAQATAANATVTLRVTGFADAPKFELSSSPQLPQDEILARLLFGESASQLSGLQVAETGAALASLSGLGGGNTLNPLARVQKALGLNRLTVGSATTTAANGTTQSAGASITAGRYVSSRVFVAATQNTTGTSQLRVDIDLTKHLKLQTRLGNGTATAQGTTPENDPGSSVGLSYQFNY
ncbi:MAG: translocation/assembly module TamB domain-containing protein [Steroidobacteraceae bacterium]